MKTTILHRLVHMKDSTFTYVLGISTIIAALIIIGLGSLGGEGRYIAYGLFHLPLGVITCWAAHQLNINPLR